ncbi:MAG: carboxypeptidase regulatory-like domain-containing protein [Acidobacteria bacterium]|nr:carboxypeptidase regulatory-like domain-containing protein [Acidobacteriota bacterium]
MKLRAALIFGLIVVSAALLARYTEAEKTVNRNEPVDGPVFETAAVFAESARIGTFLSPPKRTDGVLPAVKADNSAPAAGRMPPNGVRNSDGAIAQMSAENMPSPSLTFDGMSNYDNVTAFNLLIIPPDMTGDVGPDHYVQVVNTLFRAYDKNGGALMPPTPLSSLFAPLNTVCSTRNDGLPVVLYDPMADRWLISQYCQAFPPFRQMIAVSKTGDPTGAYYVYEFAMPNIRINDFAKFGVWPDGYYMSTEEFIGSDYAGTGMFAFDRSKMLAGDPTAGYVYFSRPSFSTARLGNILPSDMDGLRAPAPGAPNVFASFSATEYGDAVDAIRLFDFRVHFSEPLNSTFTERPESPIPVAAFDPTSPPDRTDITQPAPGERLDANSDRLNYRLAYRNLGTSESLVVNQTVRVSPSEPYRAGVRVYELRRSGGAFSVTDQATIGDTTSSRWIGSAAQDHQGNIAVGYNYVSEEKRPSIFYSGRLASDPPGTYRSEASLIDGTGVQKAFGWRWGDYSSLSVDPVDDCTFWQTGEYYTQASQDFSDFTWLSRIGRFKFAECTPAPRATIAGTVTNAVTGSPIAEAAISAFPHTRSTSATGSYGPINVLPGSYEITATKRGFRQGSAVIPVTEGEAAVRNFALQPVAVIENAGLEFVSESCRVNRVAEPGETITVNLSLRNTGLAAAQNLRANIVAINGITNASPTQTYGAMPPGGPVVTREFTFTVSPSVNCGDPLMLLIDLVDGFLSLGILQIPIASGEPRIAFSQNFDRTSPAVLPVRWSRSATGAAVNWTVSSRRSQSGSKSAFSPDPLQIGLNEMVSPAFTVSSPNAKLSFRNWYEFETTFLRNRLYDGSVLEIRIGSGEWADIIAAGGRFESGGYDGLLDSCCQNPLGGRLGWSGRSGIEQTSEFVTTTVRLPASAAGQTTQLRWRVGTDIGGFREGQYIDDLVVTDGFTCGCSN